MSVRSFPLCSRHNPLTVFIAAYEAFTLDYTVRFPLSLVISRKTILRYQLIFRHLLQLKHLERVLADTWTEHIKSPLWRKKSPYPELEQWKGRVFALRARMFAFVQQMYSFAVSGVLELNWRALEAKLDKVETVDQLLRDHVDFLDTCLKECLLTNEKLLQVRSVSLLCCATPLTNFELQLHSKLLTVCTLFASYTSHFTKSIATALALVDKAGGDWTKVPFQKQWDFLSKCVPLPFSPPYSSDSLLGTGLSRTLTTTARRTSSASTSMLRGRTLRSFPSSCALRTSRSLRCRIPSLDTSPSYVTPLVPQYPLPTCNNAHGSWTLSLRAA